MLEQWVSGLHPDVLPFFVVSGLYMIIFLVAEILRVYGQCETETTRKFAHFSGGVISLTLSYVFTSHWTILALCASFVTVILLGKRFQLLKSIHAVERKSLGDLYYPIAIWLTFLITSGMEKPHFFLIAVCTLSISDALASLIGKSYGFKLYAVEEDRKSFEGSLFFFLSTFIIVHLGLLLLSPIGRLESVLVALYMASIVTCFEAISLGGFDNMLVPIGTVYVLWKITRQPLAEIQFQLGSMLLVFVLTFVISLPKRKLGLTGVMGVSLLGYAAWSLCGLTWYLPILIGTFFFSFFDLFIAKPSKDQKVHMIRAVFYLLGSSLFWILFANLLYVKNIVRDFHVSMVPYLVSMLGHMTIIWGVRARTRLDFEMAWMPVWLSHAGRPVRAVMLTLVFAPLLFFRTPELSPLFTLAGTLIGTLLCDLLFEATAIQRMGWDGLSWELPIRRVRMLVVIIVTCFLFIANLFWYYPLA